MHGCQLMDLAAQLLVRLLVKTAILNINSDDARNNLNKADCMADKIAWRARLHANDPDKAFRITKEDNGQGHQAVQLHRIGSRFGGKVRVALSIFDQQRPSFVRHPAAITFSQSQGEMHPSQWARAVGGTQGKDALQIVIEKNGAEFDMQFFSDHLSDDFKGLIEIHRRVAHAVDALQRKKTMF